MATTTTRKKPAAKTAPARRTGVAKAARAVVEKAAPAPLSITVQPAPKAKPPAVVAAPATKAKKPKIVRDSFSIPKAEHGVIAQLKERAAKLGHPAKKNEVLRAGVKALAAMSDVAFLASIGAVPSVKAARTGKR